MVSVATFNVNSLRVRYPIVCEWLRQFRADIVLLQEIKCEDDDFDALGFASLGYEGVSFGQKAYNGVAVLSRTPIEVLKRGLFVSGDDEQARFLAVRSGGICVASLYCPNGNPVSSDKFAYKLEWMGCLESWVKECVLPSEQKWVLGGDYNICPDDRAVWDVQAMSDDALCQPASVDCYRRLLHLGFVDAWRSQHPYDVGYYSYWDYQSGRYQKNQGLLIDHLLLSPQASDALVSAEIQTKPRGWERPSDHTPVVCVLED